MPMYVWKKNPLKSPQTERIRRKVNWIRHQSKSIISDPDYLERRNKRRIVHKMISVPCTLYEWWLCFQQPAWQCDTADLQFSFPISKIFVTITRKSENKRRKMKKIWNCDSQKTSDRLRNRQFRTFFNFLFFPQSWLTKSNFLQLFLHNIPRSLIVALLVQIYFLQKCALQIKDLVVKTDKFCFANASTAFYQKYHPRKQAFYYKKVDQ